MRCARAGALIVATLAALVVGVLPAEARGKSTSSGLALGLLTAHDLSVVLAATPTPTTAAGDPVAVPLADVPTGLCKNAPVQITADEYVTGLQRGYNGQYPGASNPQYDFSYTQDDLYVFGTVAEARAYMTGLAKDLSTCQTYTYSSNPSVHYNTITGIKAPKQGDDTVVNASAATGTDGTRSDIRTFVRVGRVVNSEFAQISDTAVQSQVNRIAQAQAAKTSRIAKTAPKPAKQSATTKSTTPKADATPVKTSCDLLSAADLQSAFGIAYQNGVESTVGCGYQPSQGTAGVNVFIAPDPNAGPAYYQSLSAGGQPVDVPGAAEAKIGSDANALLTTVDISVLMKSGDAFDIQVTHPDSVSGVQPQLIAAATIAIKHLNGKG